MWQRRLEVWIWHDLVFVVQTIIWDYFTTNEIKHKFEYIFFKIVIINLRMHTLYANIVGVLGLFHLSSVSYEYVI